MNTLGSPATRRVPTLVIVLLPLLLLAGLVALLLAIDPVRALQAGFPPVEELTIERALLRPGEVELTIVNGGPDPVTVSQVMVDEAYWQHTIEPQRTVQRLGRATILIPYPWVEGDAHVVKLVTSNGVTFEKSIDVAVESPRPSWRLVGLFALLGVYVGVIPVGLGLLWYPALKRASIRWMDFFLFLTIGLLIFLGFDALFDAWELAGEEELIPGAYQGTGLLVIGVLGSIAALSALERWLLRGAGGDSDRALFLLAFMIAIGIGLHNFGEGLAIGAAYALGNLSLGTMLVLGFTLHNTTEGLAVVAPLSRRTVSIRQLILLGAIAGAPTIAGTWIGGFTYSPTWALLFLAIGAGAIFQVAWQITTQMARRNEGVVSLLSPTNAAGMLAGLCIMYITGLFVAV